ncbi:hypothetical protein HYPSUDRAFT_85634 [Hypholoma sublateritium FD-334 SS-4]|uniref:Ubiquitin 3 binding protein But2 C-terminal domain-containing protein n=1 Tax=Hypholoma sublateritium (strain FD-334 SS-4) TaxID=945553 RepID=A0A0D2P9C2_HYPSF|nr:hypothetical protein HYPSUDRAFT_85634 [Hypholoma sublateritium FD-334 SS-4]
MFRSSLSSHYDPVDDDDQPQDEKMEGIEISNTGYRATVVLYTLYLCTFINVVLITYAVYAICTNGSVTHVQKLQTLRLQDTYISLDSIYSDKSSTKISYGSIINHSRHFTKVSSSEPSRILSSDESLLLHDPGRLPYYGRRLFVNSSVSTFVQFRVMDYGMENCRLVLSVPSRNNTKAIIGQGDLPQRISLWRYPITSLLDHRKLSWATRPTQRRYFGSMEVAYSSLLETPSFTCPSLSYQTFELTCAAEDCYVDIEGVGIQSSGLFMRQYQSL